MRQFIDILNENEAVRYWVEYTGSHHGQKDGFVQAMKGNRAVGYLDFSIFEGRAKIKMIEVSDDCKRQGIATRMYEMLAGEIGGAEYVDSGYETEDGAAFMKAMKIAEAAEYDPKMFRTVKYGHEDGDWLIEPQSKRDRGYALQKNYDRRHTQGYDDSRKALRAALPPTREPKDVNPEYTMALSRASSDTGHLNGHLRRLASGGEPDVRFDPQIELLSQAIRDRAEPLKAPLHVYHGTRLDPRTIEKDGVVHFDTFISTSLHPYVAKSFAGVDQAKKERHILHFALPVGFDRGTTTMGRWAISEQEFLIDRNTDWRIVDHDTVRESSTLLSKRGDMVYRGKVHIWTLIPV